LDGVVCATARHVPVMALSQQVNEKGGRHNRDNAYN
jgi:hypothetical protein